MTTQFDEINDWADQRGLLSIDWDKCKQASFIADELAEFLKANTDNDEVGELCDVIVFAVNAIRLKGYCPNAAMSETIKKINSRTGALNHDSGKWEKDKTVTPYCPVFDVQNNEIDLNYVESMGGFDEITTLTYAEIMVFLPDIKPVAWGVGRDGKITGLSAIYPHKISAERHVNGYKSGAHIGLSLEIIELYQLPKVNL